MNLFYFVFVLLFSFIPSTLAKRQTIARQIQNCLDDCRANGRSANCENYCVIAGPVTHHESPLLDPDCVKGCNNGVLIPVKPECEQKCVYKGPPIKIKRQASSGAAADTESGCKTEYKTENEGKKKIWTTTCPGKVSGAGGRTTGMLDKNCVEACNGGPVSKLEELKPECEQKCPFKGYAPAWTGKKSFGSLGDCLKFCVEKGIAKDEQSCRGMCTLTYSGFVPGYKPVPMNQQQ